MLKSYEKPEFLNSSAGRPIRILSELLEPESTLKKYKISKGIVFFGSARILPEDVAIENLNQAKLSKDTKAIKIAEGQVFASKYYTAAYTLANMFANWSKQFVNNDKYYICTGGGKGIMEAANKGAFDAEEKNIGFNIILPFEQKPNDYLTKELTFNFHYFFMRKFWFSNLSKAIIVFPGGFGTLDELGEVLTLIQTKKIKENIPLVLFGEDFFDKTINFNFMKELSLISEYDTELFLKTNNINEAFNYVTSILKPNK